MSHDVFNGLIEQFGRSIGLADAKPDEQGYCAMSFDDLIVHFQYDDEDNSLTLFSRVGIAEDDRLEDIYAMLLSANMFWHGTDGATLAADPDTAEVFLADRRDVSHLGDAGFHDWLHRFVSISEHWTQRIVIANEGGSLDGNGESPPSDPPDTEFMTRV